MGQPLKWIKKSEKYNVCFLANLEEDADLRQKEEVFRCQIETSCVKTEPNHQPITFVVESSHQRNSGMLLVNFLMASLQNYSTFLHFE